MYIYVYTYIYIYVYIYTFTVHSMLDFQHHLHYLCLWHLSLFLLFSFSCLGIVCTILLHPSASASQHNWRERTSEVHPSNLPILGGMGVARNLKSRCWTFPWGGTPDFKSRATPNLGPNGPSWSGP